MQPQETSDAASIALLRRLRAGEGIHFVHHADVCSAAPEELVADLLPVPGTEGYSRVWYLFCAKKYKNATGKASGHRQRAIVGGDTCWRAELRAKAVEGCGDGATFCNLSYGRKVEGSARTFDRLGWCMVEYDDSTDGGGDNNNVLCKIYRSSSSLAKGKSKSASASTGSTTSSTSKSKRKAAAATDHPDARPAKFAHHHEQQYSTAFTIDYREQSQHADPDVAMLRDGNRHGGVQVEPQQQHAHLEPELGDFVDTQYGSLRSDVAQLTFDELIGGDVQTSGGGEEDQNGLLEQANGGVPEQGGEHIHMQAAPPVVTQADTVPTASAPPDDDDLFACMDPEQLFGEQQDTQQSPGAELLAQMPPPEADFFDGVEQEHLFGVGAQEELETTQQHEPCTEPVYYTSSWSSAQRFPMMIWTMQQPSAAGLFQLQTPSTFVQGPSSSLLV
ncbi:hypothetical protein BS78_01G016200 [Paspalum vaginatum]|nr:hypothetical protein BS78_01G016200 [Paspalum vaginatum]